MSATHELPFLQQTRSEVDAYFERHLPRDQGPAATIARAMRYAVLGGGKRIRPALVLAASDAAGGHHDDALPAAAAIELIHTYSLIHDDLPAMDDDDLRRGQPTVHRAFGEAEAILAGDALHTLAFEWVSLFPEGDGFATQRAAVTHRLATGAGIEGMVGGQIADLEHEGHRADAMTLDWIHAHKTGALFATSAEIGGILAGAEEQVCGELRSFGAAIGLAFQIADDLLDLHASAETLGKTPGKDLRSHKSTYPAMYGEDGARNMAEQTIDAAVQQLGRRKLHTDTLRELAHLALNRSR